jgi:hypothetical protein
MPRKRVRREHADRHLEQQPEADHDEAVQQVAVDALTARPDEVVQREAVREQREAGRVERPAERTDQQPSSGPVKTSTIPA